LGSNINKGENIMLNKKLQNAIISDLKYCTADENLENFLAQLPVVDDIRRHRDFNDVSTERSLRAKKSRAENKMMEHYNELTPKQREYIDSRKWYPQECATYVDALNQLLDGGK